MSEPQHDRRPDREGALKVAREFYPEATEQRLEEVLYTDSSYPFGGLELWTNQLADAKLQARTVFPPPPK